MALKLMYITNDPNITEIAENCGVDRIWIDLERRGKKLRQKGMDTVISDHVPSDISAIKDVLSKSDLLVRINPLYDKSREEIKEVIDRGADIVMLPMLKTAYDADRFVKFVNGRARTMLLIETAEAVSNLKEIVRVAGINEIHIGMNDLHLAYGMDFMFELLSNGTIDTICDIVRSVGIPYGFGGIAGLDEGLLPARYIIAEHYRLGSSMVILSRSFCDTWAQKDYKSIKSVFTTGINRIRQYETALETMDDKFYENNRKLVQNIVADIINKIKFKHAMGDDGHGH